MGTVLHLEVHKHYSFFFDGALSTWRPPPSIFVTKLIAIGIPIEARVPKNPPTTCFLVGFKTDLIYLRFC